MSWRKDIEWRLRHMEDDLYVHRSRDVGVANYGYGPAKVMRHEKVCSLEAAIDLILEYLGADIRWVSEPFPTSHLKVVNKEVEE